MKRADEMEKSISIKAAMLAWLTGSIALLAWILFEYISNTTLVLPALIILLLMQLVFWSRVLLAKLQIPRGEDEK